MKKRTKVMLCIMIGAPFVFLAGVHLLGFLVFAANSPLNRMSDEENIATAMEWTQLPPIPETAVNTRTYEYSRSIVSFCFRTSTPISAGATSIACVQSVFDATLSVASRNSAMTLSYS